MIGRAVHQLLRTVVELAAAGLGVCALAALAALHIPALLACVLAEDALMGLWFSLKEERPPRCWNTGTAKAVK